MLTICYVLYIVDVDYAPGVTINTDYVAMLVQETGTVLYRSIRYAMRQRIGGTGLSPRPTSKMMSSARKRRRLVYFSVSLYTLYRALLQVSSVRLYDKRTASCLTYLAAPINTTVTSRRATMSRESRPRV